MDENLIIALVALGTGVLILLIGIPLVLRIVPMNPFYGVRFPVSYKSDWLWYEINAYGGKLLVLFGIILTAYGVWGFFDPPGWFMTAHLAIVLSGVAVLVLLSYLKAKKLEREFDAGRVPQVGESAGEATVERPPPEPFKYWRGLPCATCLAFAAALAVHFAVISMGYDRLPDRVVANFDAAGKPRGWIEKERLFRTQAILGMVVAISPQVLVGASLLIGIPLARKFRGRPFSPFDRRGVFTYLFFQSLWLSAMLALLFAEMTRSLIAANLREPPEVNLTVFFVADGLFIVLVILLIAYVARRLGLPLWGRRKPQKGSSEL